LNERLAGFWNEVVCLPSFVKETPKYFLMENTLEPKRQPSFEMIGHLPEKLQSQFKVHRVLHVGHKSTLYRATRKIDKKVTFISEILPNFQQNVVLKVSNEDMGTSGMNALHSEYEMIKENTIKGVLRFYDLIEFSQVDIARFSVDILCSI
jgi:hypothetical protein